MQNIIKSSIFPSRLPIYTSSCEYLEERESEFTATDFPEGLTQQEAAKLFDLLLEEGFRRNGHEVYRNLCPQCRACLPIRIPVMKFKPSRSQRRVLRQNANWQIRCVPPKITDEKIQICQNYLTSRHDNLDNCKAVLEDLHYGYDNIIEMDYFLDGKLIGVGILDAGKRSLSSNYFYFDPEFSKYSPGVFSILKEISYAQEAGYKYYYLGYYIKNCHKMNYKAQYQPCQVFRNDKWIDFDNIKESL